jgi:hypothetical protein
MPVVVAIDVLFLFGIIGGFVWSGWQASLIALLLLLFGSIGYAAYTLQRESDIRSSPCFSLDALPVEVLGNTAVVPADGSKWSDIRALRIQVKNSGPAARFAGRITSVSRVRQLYTNNVLGNYGGFAAAWEPTDDRDWVIFQNDTGLLKIAGHGQYTFGALSGRAIWFWTPPTATWGSAGWRLQPVDKRISFNLTVTNLDVGAAISETFVIEFDDSDRITAFQQLTDVL